MSAMIAIRQRATDLILRSVHSEFGVSAKFHSDVWGRFFHVGHLHLNISVPTLVYTVAADMKDILAMLESYPALVTLRLFCFGD